LEIVDTLRKVMEHGWEVFDEEPMEIPYPYSQPMFWHEGWRPFKED